MLQEHLVVLLVKWCTAAASAGNDEDAGGADDADPIQDKYFKSKVYIQKYGFLISN